MTHFKSLFRTAALIFATLTVVMTVNAVAEAQTRGLHGAQMKIEIATKCEGDRAVFKIHNAGNRWQEAGEIIIISETEKKVIVRRKILFAKGQVARYRIPLIQKLGVKNAQSAIHIFVTSTVSSTTSIANARLECA